MTFCWGKHAKSFCMFIKYIRFWYQLEKLNNITQLRKQKHPVTQSPLLLALEGAAWSPPDHFLPIPVFLRKAPWCCFSQGESDFIVLLFEVNSGEAKHDRDTHPPRIVCSAPTQLSLCIHENPVLKKKHGLKWGKFKCLLKKWTRQKIMSHLFPY